MKEKKSLETILEETFPNDVDEDMDDDEILEPEMLDEELIQNFLAEDEENIRGSDLRDNSLDWYLGEKTMTVTFTQRKLINKILKMAEQFPDEVTIDCYPQDNEGILLAHIPLSYLHIKRPRQVSEEQRERMRAVAAKNIAEGKLKPKTRKEE